MSVEEFYLTDSVPEDAFFLHDNENNQATPVQTPGCAQFHAIQNDILNCCGREGPDHNPLCKAVNSGEIVSRPPYNCMINLIDKYCTEGQTISDEQKKAAFNAFSDTTGFKPMDLTKIVNNLANQGNNLANFNSFYMFMPITILLIIFIWLMVGFKRINWALGLFATVFVIVILYSFSIAYRLNVQTYVRNRQSSLNNEIEQAEENYRNSVAYWNQGLFAAACAVTCTGGTGCWSCQKKTNPASICDQGSCDPIVEPKDTNKDIENLEQPIRKVRKRKSQGRKSSQK
jgi:hypothetical protein